jgi:hypothetical protein
MPSGAKNFGHRTPRIAVNITQMIRNAPMRVNNPRTIKRPPINSAKAAAPIHAAPGRIKEKGAGNEVNFENPGPPNEPNTFCAPCPIKATPIANRSGTVAQVAEVPVNLRSIKRPPCRYGGTEL